MINKNVLIVTGPTASGKSSLSVQLAKILDGEIISADSSQVYCGLDIGSAKITPEEMKDIPHHLIDIKQPNEDFSVAEFKNLALDKIKQIISRNKTPIICGGTGLYIKALVNDYDFSNTPKNQDLREKIKQEIIDNGLLSTYNKLVDIAPEFAKTINENDEVRIIRAFEKVMGEKNDCSNVLNDYNYFVYVINDDRQIIYNNINKRVDLMIKDGLFEEVQKLIKQGINKNNSCFKSIGYKEIYDYYANNLDKNETIELIKQKTRNYAKRQLTLYRGMKNVIWIDGENKLEKILNDYKYRTNRK